MAALALPRPVFARRRSIVLSRSTPIVQSEDIHVQASQDGSLDTGFNTFDAPGAELSLPSGRFGDKPDSETARLAVPTNAEAGPSRPTSQGQANSPSRQQTQRASVKSRGEASELEKKKKHICRFDGCGKAFKKAAKLSDHMLSHTDDRPHQCPHCPSRYKKPTHLSAHIRTHLSSESKTFVCCKIIAASVVDNPEHNAGGIGGRKADDGSREDDGVDRAGTAICGKRFWTSQHLTRHEEVCGKDIPSTHPPLTHRSTSDPSTARVTDGERRKGKSNAAPIDYPCPTCSERFRKHRLLQLHYSETHPIAHNAFEDQEQGTATTGSRDLEQKGVKGKWLVPVAKRYRCEHEGCEWSFETMQKLKGHAKTHDASRYICAHADHSFESEKPKFRTWTDLQKHMRDDHPPCCPYPECHKRQFTRQSNLRDHLRIHAERGETIETSIAAALQASHPKLAGSAVDVEEEEDNDEIEIEMTSRKRKRSESVGGQASPNRRLRRTSSVGLVKDWVCETEGCAKSFKTETALKKHNQTAHLGLRPFICSETDCDKSFGHRHLLQRHMAAKHKPNPPPGDAGEESQINLISTQPATSALDLKPETPISTLDLLTGASREIAATSAGRLLQCPIDWTSIVSGCGHRSIKVYDLQRHIKKEHGLDLQEVEVRVLMLQAEGYMSRR